MYSFLHLMSSFSALSVLRKHYANELEEINRYKSPHLLVLKRTTHNFINMLYIKHCIKHNSVVKYCIRGHNNNTVIAQKKCLLLKTDTHISY